MRDDDDRHLGRKLGHQVLDLLNGGGIDGGARLVHQENVRLHSQNASDAQSLLLATRERQAVFRELIGDLFP